MSKVHDLNGAKYTSNPKGIEHYRNAALAADDSGFIRALGNLARAQGMGAIAEEANVDRAGLYRSLRGDADPKFSTILKVLTVLGVQLEVKPRADEICTNTETAFGRSFCLCSSLLA